MGQGVARRQDVAYEIVDGVAVLLDPTGAEMIVLNAVGSVVWEALDGTRDEAALVRHVIARVRDADEDDVQRDINAFLSELKRAGLVRTAG